MTVDGSMESQRSNKKGWRWRIGRYVRCPKASFSVLCLTRRGYENKASLDCKYSAAAILVMVPTWRTRRGVV
jgi:hypothetical protein